MHSSRVAKHTFASGTLKLSRPCFPLVWAFRTHKYDCSYHHLADFNVLSKRCFSACGWHLIYDLVSSARGRLFDFDVAFSSSGPLRWVH